jgi:hypothetical protein
VSGPGDDIAAACGSHMRASHADRERVVYTLKVAFVQGRLTKDEFERRIGRTLASRTYGQLSLLTADLPDGLIRTRLPSLQRPTQTGPPVNRPLMWFTFAATLGGLGSIVSAFPAEQFLLLVLGVFSVLLAAPVAGTLMLDSWRANRSDGKPPRSAVRPGHAIQDRPSREEPDGQDGNDLALCTCRASANWPRTMHLPVRPV